MILPAHHWARNFTVSRQDVEYLTSLLLEKEIPLSTEELASALIQQRIQEEAAILKDRYQDTLLYSPAHSYQPGQKLVFPAFDYETGTVVGVRAGNNTEYGDFEVITVKFDNEALNNIPGEYRQFAANLKTPHKLSQAADRNGTNPALELNNLTADDILLSDRDNILSKLAESLKASPDLIYLAQKWFPRDLLLEVNLGHLNLAEAVLDLAGGGPYTAEAILDEIGGLGKAPIELQVFSLNDALNQDDRFDEVGPTGEVLWFLTRLEPAEVRHTPVMLRYTPIDYDSSLLTDDMLALEAEIGDELSPLDPVQVDEATVGLIYPHRRMGTLPLNNKTVGIFPTARQTPRVWVTLVDGQDGEEFPAWVVRKERYVFGLAPFYRKHKLPIGAAISVRRSDEAGKVVVDFHAYRPRTEWIRLIVPRNDQIVFENQKRAIGAEYDELMIMGADDLPAVDALSQAAQQQKRSIVSILRAIIPSLAGLTPQGTVHAKTLYSAVNVLRRCPPGPVMATLVANPDFQNVGGHYWKLRSE